jgi:hypothetical protein
VPLVDDAKAIIASIPKHPKNDKVFWNLPSGQVINRYLKFFGLGAGIQEIYIFMPQDTHLLQLV